MTERWTDERLDRFAASIDQSRRDSDARMTRLEQQFAQQNAIATQRIDRLDQLIAAVTESTIELKENTAQLKRTMDYLLSRDGG